MKYFICFLFFVSQFTYSQDAKTLRLLRKALDYEQNGDISKAIATHKEIFNNTGSQSYESANTIAGLNGQLGNSKEEIYWAEKAIKIKPDYANAYINLGNGYALNNDFEKAKKYYELADTIDPSSPLPVYSLGVIEENNGDFKSAVSYYEQSVSRDPAFENGYFNLAAAYANLKDFEKANKNILKVLELDPSAKDAQEMHKHIIQELPNH